MTVAKHIRSLEVVRFKADIYPAMDSNYCMMMMMTYDYFKSKNNY